MTGSRGFFFGPIFAPVVDAFCFGTFSLLADVVVDVCGSKLDAVFKIYVTLSDGRVCAACGLETWLARSKANSLFKSYTCFMRACWSIFCCMGSLDVEVTAVTGVVIGSSGR